MDAGGRIERKRSHSLLRGMRVLIDRSIAGYTLFILLPALPQIIAQLPRTALWWTIVFGGAMGVSVVVMVVASFHRRSIRAPGLVYAAALLGGIATGPFAFSPALPHTQPWLWWGVGAAVVLVGLALGGRVATVYVLLLAGLYGALRPTPAFGGVDVITAVSEAVFAPVSSLAVLAVALGMLNAASSADELSDRVYQRELSEAVDREVSEARAQLDRLIHDDVMTTLTALARADDDATAQATAALAHDTLTRIDALEAGTDTSGTLSIGVFERLAEDTARRVSPSVEFSDRTGGADRDRALPIATSESLLGAMREAVRNAARHADAHQIDVSCEFSDDLGAGPEPQFVVTVRDDGRGFEPGAIPSARLGIALSVRATMESVGGRAVIDSSPGDGTAVRLSCPIAALPKPGVARHPDDRRGPQLPVAFPVDLLVKICWGVVAIGVGLGVLNLDRVAPIWSTVASMPLLCLAAFLILRRTPALRLPWVVATTAVLLILAVAIMVCAGLPTDSWPDAAIFWFIFPLQLLLPALVFRQRVGHAVAALILLAGALGWWSWRSIDGTAEFLNAVFGPAAFLLIALAVRRILGRIAAERHRLRSQERSAIDESARRYAALVQRSLWLADLRATARGVLLEIAALTSPAPAGLVSRALLLEAKLREAVLARNVMSDELADLIDAARRRGISVVFVDSRQSPLPNEVGRTVVSEVRRILASATVSRLVVRLAPAGRAQSASLVSDDWGDTRMISIDPEGAFIEPVGDGPAAVTALSAQRSDRSRP